MVQQGGHGATSGGAGGADGVQEESDEAGPGDGHGDERVQAARGAAHRPGRHGDAAGGVDTHC